MPDETMIPMLDLKAQYARIRPEIDEAMARVVASAQFIFGEECAAFESEFAAYCGVAHACGVGNGTDALTVGLWALGVKDGDEVVTVANTFVATGEAILINGAKPVFADVDLETFTMDPRSVQRLVTPRTKAIVPVHLFGLSADMTPILDFASKKGLPVLEDAAQAHGATYGEKRAGSMGIGGCFSFYPAKNLGAYGDAGAVVSHDANFIERVRRISHHGAGRNKYDNVVPGTNSRLDALQAAVLRVKLRHLPQWNEERRARAAAYSEGLHGLPSVVLPRERAGSQSVWHCYTLRAKDRDDLRDHLQARGITTAVHYPKPLHLQPAMSSAGARMGDVPNSERLCREVLSLPLYPELPMETVARVVAEIRAYYKA
jgi:dTDP-4-amino-4,6-dideoxygalactose transaminase